jgi:CheY-like chemotaxis protein
VQLPGAQGHADTDAIAPAVVALLHSDRAAERLQQDLAGTVVVVGTSDAGQVARLARQERAAVVAIDVRTPHSGGWRALASLQADRETADLPTLLFAHEDDDGEIALDLALFHALAKPLYVEHARELIISAHTGPRPIEHVLIADVDPDVRRILGEALVAAGCRVSTARDGGQLLRSLADDPPDVLVLDLLAPAISGVEVLAQLQTDRELRDLPLVVLLTPELALEDMERLDRVVAALARGRRARAVPSGELVREALARNPREGALSAR